MSDEDKCKGGCGNEVEFHCEKCGGGFCEECFGENNCVSCDEALTIKTGDRIDNLNGLAHLDEWSPKRKKAYLDDTRGYWEILSDRGLRRQAEHLQDAAERAATELATEGR